MRAQATAAEYITAIFGAASSSSKSSYTLQPSWGRPAIAVGAPIHYSHPGGGQQYQGCTGAEALGGEAEGVAGARRLLDSVGVKSCWALTALWSVIRLCPPKPSTLKHVEWLNPGPLKC
eukprot:361851-Chlamydomonas_euryale.AAC.2